MRGGDHGRGGPRCLIRVDLESGTIAKGGKQNSGRYPSKPLLVVGVVAMALAQVTRSFASSSLTIDFEGLGEGAIVSGVSAGAVISGDGAGG
jgi:hypothetical protein